MKRKWMIVVLTTLLMNPLWAGEEAVWVSVTGQPRPVAVEEAVTLTRSGDDGLSFICGFAGFESFDVATRQGTFSRISVPGFTYTQRIGEPALPLSRRIVAVPVGASVTAEAVSFERSEISLAAAGILYPVMPAQPSLSKSERPEDVPFDYDAQAYARSGYDERPLVSVEELGILRGLRLFAVDVEPVLYDPARGMLAEPNVPVPRSTRLILCESNSILREGLKEGEPMRTIILVLLVAALAQAQPYNPVVLWDRSGAGDNASYGYRVFGLGDQNNDRYNDFAVWGLGQAAPGDSDQAVVEFFHGGNPPETEPYMRFTADPATEFRFYDVNAAGDVNGDGYIDWWILRMTTDESTFTFQVYYGGPNADTIPDVVLHPGLSFWIAAGDFNGDGFDDLYANYQESPGHGVAYYGGSPMDTMPDLTIHSRPGHRYEAYAWSFGDLNGDGYSDFVSDTPPRKASPTSFSEAPIPTLFPPSHGRITAVGPT